MSVDIRIETEPPRLVAAGPEGETELPALWLRERCQDDAQVDPTTRQRLFNPHRLPEDLVLTAVSTANDGGAWLTFSDGYRGFYDLEALVRDFDLEDAIPEPQVWDARLDLGEMTFEWPRLGDERDLELALATFLTRGFILFDGVETEPEKILEVAGTFGHVRSTNFGRYFEVYSRPAANDLAYSALALGPHTDNPYREPVPGIQLLHCLANETSEGLSTLTDSLAVADEIASQDPEAFDLLCEIPVVFRFTDGNEDFVERRTIIRRNDAGEMVGLHYSPRLDYLPLLEPERLAAFQRARRRLGELLVDPRFEQRFGLRPGQLLMFDNSRVVHGRTGFDPSEGRRHLQGCYIDIDAPRSRYRTIRRTRSESSRREA